MLFFESTSIRQVPQWLGRHALFWLLVTGGMTYVAYAIRMPRIDWLSAAREMSTMLPYTILITYLALYTVLPLALAGQYDRFAHRSVLFVVGSWVLIGLYRGYVVIPLVTGKLRLFPPYQELVALLDWYIALVIAGVAAGIKLYRFGYKREQINQQLALETLTVELQVLKAQIHPHFLFNTLNNLYALTLTQSPKAPDIVLKLADLLHYMSLECNRPAVPLASELAFLENYIQLEKLRYGDRLAISLTKQGDLNAFQIAPLLLIPFVENAFKHGSAQQTGHACIDISIGLSGNEMLFTVENSLDETAPQTTSRQSADLGLTTVQKRLSLLYPDAHHLGIRSGPERFIIELTMQLHDNRMYAEHPADQ